jgi:hypothetical protein
MEDILSTGLCTKGDNTLELQNGSLRFFDSEVPLLPSLLPSSSQVTKHPNSASGTWKCAPSAGQRRAGKNIVSESLGI